MVENYYVKGRVLYLTSTGRVRASSKTKERIIHAKDAHSAIASFLYLEAGLENVKFTGECTKAVNSFDHNVDKEEK